MHMMQKGYPYQIVQYFIWSKTICWILSQLNICLHWSAKTILH